MLRWRRGLASWISSPFRTILRRSSARIGICDWQAPNSRKSSRSRAANPADSLLPCVGLIDQRVPDEFPVFVLLPAMAEFHRALIHLASHTGDECSEHRAIHRSRGLLLENPRVSREKRILLPIAGGLAIVRLANP